jgi:heat shock protein beta
LQPIFSVLNNGLSDPKEVTDEEYKNFYQATFKEHKDPVLWHHFKGDSGPVSFKALIFVPESL